jgi:predicted RNase H-like nuclease (RuvC/YqgF family)
VSSSKLSQKNILQKVTAPSTASLPQDSCISIRVQQHLAHCSLAHHSYQTLFASHKLTKNMTTESQQSRIHASIIREIIRALEPSAENKDSHIKELQVKPILEKGIRDLERSLEIKTSRIRALKSSLESKDSRIKALQSAKLTSLQRIRELQHSLKIKDNRIKGLEAANLTLDASDKRHAVERIKASEAPCLVQPRLKLALSS